MLFAENAALTAQAGVALLRFVSWFAKGIRWVWSPVSIHHGAGHQQHSAHLNRWAHPGVVENFTYLWSTISSNLSLDAQLNTRIDKLATKRQSSLATKRVWDNSMLSTNTKMRVYQACMLSTLLYDSESWTLCARQERRLNTFHLHSIRRIPRITWQDRVPNNDVLAQVGIPSVFALLSLGRLCWLGHVSCMQDARIPKDMLFGELVTTGLQTWRKACPSLYKDVCKRCEGWQHRPSRLGNCSFQLW